jgi:hypothetical protein
VQCVERSSLIDLARRQNTLRRVVNYYLYQNDEPKGPYTLGQLRSMWHAGSITGETHYCVAGSDQWLRLKLMITELEPLAKQQPEAHPKSVPKGFVARLMREENLTEKQAIDRRRKILQGNGINYLSCPRCEGPATGTRGCVGVLFFPISLLLMKSTYTCEVCGFRFKQ